jgi:hypothetical protein
MKEKNNKGQSTIEFILTFTAAVGFIFLFLKMALNYTNGYMVHHATFMASRAYLISDSERYGSPGDGDADAFKLAKAVFNKNLPDALIPNFDGVLKENNPGIVGLAVFVGVWTEFTQAFSVGFVGGKERIVFRSESFLGREPTRAESTSQVCAAIKAVTGGGCETQATLDDNGG